MWRACKKQSKGEGERNAGERNQRHQEATQEADPMGLQFNTISKQQWVKNSALCAVEGGAHN